MSFPYDGIGFEPDRVFTIGTSDYSSRVIKWPTISRTTNQLKSTNVALELANTDQHFNTFYNNLYTMPLTCTIICDSYTLFTGFLKDVQYVKDKCKVTLKDRFSIFGERKIGTEEDEISISGDEPSDIAWTVCACAGLSTEQSEDNPDIDYTSFLAWAETFSRDSIIADAYYNGQNANFALEDLSELTDADIWVDRFGKVQFKARIDISSNDVVIDDDYIADLMIRIEGDKLVTRQYVYGAYSTENNEWSIVVNHQYPAYVTSYGLYEDIIKSENFWYQNSVYAIYLAQKRIARYGKPPIVYNVKCPIALIDTTIGDRVRLVNSFFSITSEQAWRVVSEKINIEAGLIEFELDGSRSFEPFILDVSYLDGTDVLL